MKKSDEIRNEIKFKRKQLSNNMSFVKNKMTDLLFKEISELNQKLSIAIEKENSIRHEEYIYSGTKSFDEDAREIDDSRRHREWRNEETT